MQHGAHDQSGINPKSVNPNENGADYTTVDYVTSNFDSLSFADNPFYSPYPFCNNLQPSYSAYDHNATLTSSPLSQIDLASTQHQRLQPYAYSHEPPPSYAASYDYIQPANPVSPPAKPTLNAHAPEFVPSFAVLPAEEPLPADHPLYTPTVFNPPETTVEHAVENFERQFPPLPGSKTSPTDKGKPVLRKALGWHEIEHEKREKERWQKHLDVQHNFVQTLEAVNDAPETHEQLAPVSGDVGNVWVSTGRSVAELYEELRAEAAEQASIRNKYFDRAAAAFKRNDGATAKKMGALGREANERMKELHSKAANAIFATRNPPHVLDVIDLHGLHVNEALERLPSALEGKHGRIRILTGTGHHTKGTGRARLRPAVKKWLKDNDYFFEEVVDANEYVGSFIVDIEDR
ncbi:polyadenylate-binding protein-interacting protein [Gracilaria domingensis]|nr:polyadenylate-binding protein-interacting protein [Gracilaria domingensis]